MNEIIIAEVTYYVQNIKTTKEDVAESYHKSISSIKKDFAKFRQYVEMNPECEYKELYNKEHEKAIINEMLGRKKGGSKQGSGRKRTLDLKEALEIAKTIISQDRSLREQSIDMDIPKSTLYECLLRLEESNDNQVNKVLIDLKTTFLKHVKKRRNK